MKLIVAIEFKAPEKFSCLASQRERTNKRERERQRKHLARLARPVGGFHNLMAPARQHFGRASQDAHAHTDAHPETTS